MIQTYTFCHSDGDDQVENEFVLLSDYEKANALLEKAQECLIIESENNCKKKCDDYGGCNGATCNFVTQTEEEISSHLFKTT